MQVIPLGDSALIIRVRENLEGVADDAIDEVLMLMRQILNAQIPGIVECAPAYTTIGIFFDPARVIAAGAEPENIFDWLDDRIQSALDRNADMQRPTVSIVEVPVCYEEGFALDLDEIAGRAGISTDEVIELHCNASYRVSCLGFTPGFPYLNGLPNKLATPRRAVPRKEVPAGSVAIGGAQTGIYPLRSPGGWNVLGRTPLRLFEAGKNPPALLHPGDCVRFRSITRDEFISLEDAR